MWDKMPKLVRQQPTEGPDGAVRLVLEVLGGSTT
jgi:hypothetical protein